MPAHPSRSFARTDRRGAGLGLAIAKETTEIPAPAIDGIKPDEICELWTQGWFMYEKGGPKHVPLKKWRAGEAIFQSAMLCSNKDEFSSRTPK